MRRLQNRNQGHMAPAPMNLLPQLESIFNDVRRAIDAALYYPALAVALTVPEICITLCWDRDMMVKEKHYKDFIDTYSTPQELGVDGLGCYRLRGGVIHRGNASGHPKFAGTHVLFTTPEAIAKIHALTIQVGDKSAAMFDLDMFCSGMIQAAKRWYEKHKDHPKVVENLPRLLSLRPFGLSPFVVGVPVIASEA